MDHPAEQEDPENPGEYELNDGDEEASLHQVAQPGDEEAGERSDDVPCRALPRHMVS